MLASAVRQGGEGSPGLCARVRALAAARWDGPLEGLAVAELDGLLRDLRSGIDALEMLFARGLRRFDELGGPALRGATSAADWVRRECNLSGAQAAERAEVGRQLDELPLVAAAAAAGRIGYAHVAVLARTAADLGEEAMRASEATLVAAAAQTDPGTLRSVARAHRFAVDPDGAEAAYARLQARRFLRLTDRADGAVAVEGRLDPEGGVMVRTALSPLMHAVKDDPRSRSQRCADALVELARRQLDAGRLPRTGGRRPNITVTVSRDALAGAPGAAPLAELGSGVVVPVSVCERLLCDAAVRVLVEEGKGLPLAVGRKRRTATEPQWVAMVRRDRHCRFPRCDQPPEKCVPHHQDSWVFRGRTDYEAMCLLCTAHHGWVHQGGWTLVGDPSGEIDALPPDRRGRPVTVDPQGRRIPQVWWSATPVRRGKAPPGVSARVVKEPAAVAAAVAAVGGDAPQAMALAADPLSDSRASPGRASP